MQVAEAKQTKNTVSKTETARRGLFFQPKLTVNAPGDEYEQEADAMADKVMRMSDGKDTRETFFKPALYAIHRKHHGPDELDELDDHGKEMGSIHRKCAACEEEDKHQVQRKEISAVQLKCNDCEEEEKHHVQKKGNGSSSQFADSSLESSLLSSKGAGSSLPDDTRVQMESSFGNDFSNVRIHNDSNAAQMSKELHAQAFTHGNDIYFDSGKYDTSSKEGQHLLAHELTHVVQQTGISKANKIPFDNQSEKVSGLVNHYTLSEANTGTKNDRRNVMNRELNHAGSQPGVKVEKNANSPSVLKPENGLPERKNNNKKRATSSRSDNRHSANLTHNQIGRRNDNSIKAVKNKKASATNKHLIIPSAKTSSHQELNQDHKKGEVGIEDEILPPLNVSEVRNGLNKKQVNISDVQQLIEAGRNPQQDKVEVQTHLNKLSSNVENDKADVKNDFAGKKNKIKNNAVASRVDILAKSVALKKMFEVNFNSTKEELTIKATQKKEEFDEAFLSDTAKMESFTTKNKLTLATELATKKFDFSELVLTQSRQPMAIAQQESLRANGEIDQAADEALQVGENEASIHAGSNDSNPDKRAAARDVAKESANDIRSKKQGIADDLYSRATEFSGSYSQYSNKITSLIDETSQNVLPSFDESMQIDLGIIKTYHETSTDIIDHRLHSDLSNLEKIKTETIRQIQLLENSSLKTLETAASQSIEDIALHEHKVIEAMTHTYKETQLTIEAEDQPFLPGVDHLMNTSLEQIANIKLAGKNFLELNNDIWIKGTSNPSIQFHKYANQLDSETSIKIKKIKVESTTSTEQVKQDYTSKSQGLIQQLNAKHESISSVTLAEVNKGIEGAKSEVMALTEKFRTDIIPATNDSIVEAKKPLTDPLPERAHEAAEQVDESWVSGLFRAIGDIVVGLILVVVLALVIVAIAAAFEVVIAIGAAMLIAGAVLLLVSLGINLYKRFSQTDLKDSNPFTKIGLALFDTIGGTGIYESATGKDIVTGKHLSEGERTYRGTMGVFTLISLFLGARAGAKGVAGGDFASLGGDWDFVGWRDVIPAMGKAVKGASIDLITGLGKQAKGVVDWFKDLLGKDEPPEVRVPKPSTGLPEIKVESAQSLKATSPINEGGKISWKLYDDVSKATFAWQEVDVTPTGEPEGGPHQLLEPKKAILPPPPDNSLVTLKAKGFSWTEESVRLMMEVFQKTFGKKAPNLSGAIAIENIENFRNEFAKIKIQNPSLSDQEIGNQAIRKISFGTARIQKGYGNLTVDIYGSTTITLDGTVVNVPQGVYVNALPDTPGIPLVPSSPTQNNDDDDNN